ncbi:hypothetical protein DFH09DRAFT_1076031 [Mycena vulgaris]|nr:hypothetical protein DFH09DRAFT_1076031 [Mycena vulgaris]
MAVQCSSYSDGHHSRCQRVRYSRQRTPPSLGSPILKVPELRQKWSKEKPKKLPEGTPPELVEGLTYAHCKLNHGDYYYKYDQSPFYIWAALLDPRFNDKKLRKNYAADEDLSAYFKNQKRALPSATANPSKSRPGTINFAAYDQ